MKQIAASPDGGDRGSPATMEKSVRSAKKPRLEPLSDTQVKEEAAAHEASVAGAGGGGGGGGGSASRSKGTIKIDMGLFECTLCSRPLKPPVFQCKGGHLACGGCLPGEGCRKCEHGGGGGFDVRSTAMDAFVSAARVVCSHDGCRIDVVYHELSDHQSACPHAPCSCPETGCGFVGPPPALVAHPTARHSVPVHKIPYGKDLKLQVSASEPSRRLLLGEDDDDRAFLLSASVHGAATAVWVVCIGASAGPRPHYICRMVSWLGPRPSLDLESEYVLVKRKVTSSTSPGAVAATPFLTVPPHCLVGAAATKEVPLTIRIDKIY